MSESDPDLVRQEIQARIDRGSDPALDAAEAARRGEFGLILTGGRGLARPAGVTCFTPYWRPPLILAAYRYGDVLDAQTSAWLQYATAYNQAIVDSPDYPDPDLCRVEIEGDTAPWRDTFPVATAARRISAPPVTLHQAARRGSAADLRRLLADGAANSLDSFGMTPLAWAVARDNGPAVALLLKAGASSWTKGSSGPTAIFIAARLGQRSLFERLEKLPGRSFPAWPSTYLAAAATGGDIAIAAHMLGQPHEAFRFELLQQPLPPAAVLEAVLKASPELATPLLWKAADHPGDRPDLIRLALAHGADPNAVGSGGRYGTVLGVFADGISPDALEIVDMLLKAGADPNQMSHRDRPIWRAVGTLKLGTKNAEIEGRAHAVFRRLVAGGADLNLPNDENVPPAWLLLFPYRGDHEKLDASFVTPRLLEMLVDQRLDLNARWQGQRLLPLVEAQAGAQSELATTLRRLGALP